MKFLAGRTELQRWLLMRVSAALKKYDLEDDAIDAQFLYAVYLDTLGKEPTYTARAQPDAFMAHYSFLKRHWGLTTHNPKGPH